MVIFSRRDSSSTFSVTAPSESEGNDKGAVPTEKQEFTDLANAITAITAERRVYDESKLPPRIPTAFRRWIPERAPDAPHDPDSYFPMVLYK